MADTYPYLVFFYCLSGATITLAIILFFETGRIKRQVRRIEDDI
ncbi:MAG: hypothetical protein ACE5HH_02245 [Candidatus Hydrothermarchaeales archaeon]